MKTAIFLAMCLIASPLAAIESEFKHGAFVLKPDGKKRCKDDGGCAVFTKKELFLLLDMAVKHTKASCGSSTL